MNNETAAAKKWDSLVCNTAVYLSICGLSKFLAESSGTLLYCAYRNPNLSQTRCLANSSLESIGMGKKGEQNIFLAEYFFPIVDNDSRKLLEKKIEIVSFHTLSSLFHFLGKERKKERKKLQ